MSIDNLTDMDRLAARIPAQASPELTAYWLTRRAEARRSMADDAPVLAGSREAADELSARLRDEADHLVNLTAAVAGPLIAQQAGIYLDLMVPPAYD